MSWWIWPFVYLHDDTLETFLNPKVLQGIWNSLSWISFQLCIPLLPINRQGHAFPKIEKGVYSPSSLFWPLTIFRRGDRQPIFIPGSWKAYSPVNTVFQPRKSFLCLCLSYSSSPKELIKSFELLTSTKGMPFFGRLPGTKQGCRDQMASKASGVIEGSGWKACRKHWDHTPKLHREGYGSPER